MKPPIMPALAALLALTAAVYWRGLGGPFLLDDEINLNNLGAYGGLHSLWDVVRYAVTGSASALGRPLTLLTFAANAQNWPADPWWFKATNLGLHLTNGALLCHLARRLALRAGATLAAAPVVALGAAGLWLLHPIHFSAVLYVSQRMVLIAALFTLAGLIAYVHGRELVVRRPAAGLWLQSAGIGVGGTLAVLGKETGILLPLFALVLEATLLRDLPRPRRWRWWAAVFLWLPLLALVAYLVFGPGNWLLGPGALLHTWMTQTRVLLGYLGNICFPFVRLPGLFHDDFMVSRGLLAPPTTLAAVLAVAALLACGWALRRRLPVLSFAILWFFAGHALESSLPNTTAVYEYRNYLPLLGPAFALAWYLCRVGRRGRLGSALLLLLCAALAWTSAHYAAVWGDEAALAKVWAAQHPASPRAQLLVSRAYLQGHQYGKALQQLQAARKRMPDNLSVALKWLQLRCLTNTVNARLLEQVAATAGHAPYDYGNDKRLRTLEAQAYARRCPPLDLQAMIDLLAVVIANPQYRRRVIQHRLRYRRAVMLSEIGHMQAAVRAANRSLAYGSDPTAAYNAARWLLQAGKPRRALEYLQRARRAARPHGGTQRLLSVPSVRAHDRRAFAELETTIRAALAAKKTSRRRQKVEGSRTPINAINDPIK
ncbi:MAG: hypothetical protein L0H83_07000 [Salinisphaera sp.]|nr:hypothetical protein [Salinisphaera sp.]